MSMQKSGANEFMIMRLYSSGLSGPPHSLHLEDGRPDGLAEDGVAHADAEHWPGRGQGEVAPQVSHRHRQHLRVTRPVA